jgi:hypothetical protein
MWNAYMLKEIQPWLVVGLTYISFIDNTIHHIQFILRYISFK